MVGYKGKKKIKPFRFVSCNEKIIYTVLFKRNRYTKGNKRLTKHMKRYTMNGYPQTEKGR